MEALLLPAPTSHAVAFRIGEWPSVSVEAFTTRWSGLVTPRVIYPCFLSRVGRWRTKPRAPAQYRAARAKKRGSESTIGPRRGIAGSARVAEPGRCEPPIGAHAARGFRPAERLATLSPCP